MNLSAILVIALPSQMEVCARQLSRLPGITVHHFDAASGKIVVTQEAASIDDEIEGLKRIKALAEVSMAEMVYHYFEDDESVVSHVPDDLDVYQGLARLPEFFKSSAK